MKNDGINHLLVCRRIKKAARDAGMMSKAKLSSLTGISPKTIWNIWNERVKVSQDTVDRMAKALGVSPAYLMTGAKDAASAAEPAPALAVLEGPGKKYGSGGLTMADAIKMISEQLGVPEDAVREKISELLRKDDGPTKRKG